MNLKLILGGKYFTLTVNVKVVLQVTGILFIVAGLIFGFSQISDLKEQHENVEYWEEAADDNYDNNLIEERYLSIKNEYKSNLTLTIGSVLSGIISAIFFMALATVIDLLQKLVNKNETLKNYNTKTNVPSENI